MTVRKNVLVTALVAASLAASLAVAFNIAVAQDAEAQANKFTRRISVTSVETSVAHNAEGHSSHQVVNFFSPQDGSIYSGRLTFTSSKGVDIIAYHDITGQNATGLKTWKVGDKTYATTTLLTNATAGTVDFVGAGILAHSAASDTYTVVFTADGLAKKMTVPAASMMSEQGMMHGQGN
jgi:hypothetical protein